MKRFWLLAALALLSAPPAFAQPVDSDLYSPTYLSTSVGARKEAIGTFCIDPATGLVCSGGGGGGGGGDASASNQSAQIVQETLTNTRLGDITTPAAGTVNSRLGVINTTLGSPFQAGGSIGNTAFGASQSGTWNITDVSGTISLPTGAATSALQTTANGYLDGLEGLLGGTLTVGLPSGASTAANQSTANGYLASLAGAVSTTNLNVICTSGCGGGSGYSILNDATYANTSSYSNVPSGGLVTTAAPTYTTARASPLSLTTGGLLRVDGSGVTQPVSGSLTNISGTISLPTGAATAANQVTEQGYVDGLETVLGTTADAAVATGATGSVSAKLRQISTQIGSPIQATGGTVGLVAGSATIGNVGGLGTDGSAVTGGVNRIGGKDASGNAQDILTDTHGGIAVAGMSVASTRSSSLTTSTSTALSGGGATTRPSYFKIQVEGALTANLFLCLNNQTCSATAYDEMIPSGAVAGTRLFVEVPFTTAVNYYTTATAIVNVTRWSN